MTSHSPVVIEAFQKMMDRYSEGGGVADLGNDRNMTHLASVLTYVEAEALARGRMEGAKAMQEAVILKLDECCEPCFQCNQNVTALDPTAIVKELNDAD